MAKTSSTKHAGKGPKSPSVRKQLALAHSPGRLHSLVSSKYSVRMSKGARYALACVLDYAVKDLVSRAKARAVKKEKVGEDKIVVPRRMTPRDIRIARDNDTANFLQTAYPGLIPQTGFAASLVQTGRMKKLALEKEKREARAAEKEVSRKERKRKADKAKSSKEEIEA